MTEEICLWCDKPIKPFTAFCRGCGMWTKQAVRVRPYVTEGIKPDDIVIDPFDGLQLLRNNFPIDIFNPDGAHLSIRINPESIEKLAAKSDTVYLEFLGIKRRGLVLTSTNCWGQSFCLGYDYFHRELFGVFPNISAIEKVEITSIQKYHWFAVGYDPCAAR